MQYSMFRERFYAAVEDFANHRRIKDELAAYAAVNVQGLSLEKSLPTQMVVHQVMLVAAYPELKVAACMTAYKHSVPRLIRLRIALEQWHAALADPPDQLPPLRSHD